MVQYHSDKAVQKAYDSIANAVKEAEFTATSPNIGKGNTKTKAYNEGTSPLITCQNADCKHYCYAVWHIDNFYKQARRIHAENTVLRRRDPIAYYEAFFSAAEKKNILLRLNETGDFENLNQLNAACTVAARHPSVKALGYTHRDFALGVKIPANLRLMYSLFSDFCDGNATYSLPVTMVSQNKTTCPSQIRNDKIKAGAKLPAWTCNDCAKANIGCFGNDKVIFKAH